MSQRWLFLFLLLIEATAVYETLPVVKFTSVCAERGFPDPCIENVDLLKTSAVDFGGDNFVVNGVVDPTIVLQRGRSYIIENNDVAMMFSPHGEMAAYKALVDSTKGKFGFATHFGARYMCNDRIVDFESYESAVEISSKKDCYIVIKPQPDAPNTIQYTGNTPSGDIIMGGTIIIVPTITSKSPTRMPTKAPTTEEKGTTRYPTMSPTTSFPTRLPTADPTASPTSDPGYKLATGYPTAYPTMSPTTSFPTRLPTKSPTESFFEELEAFFGLGPGGEAEVTRAPTKRPTTAYPTMSPTTSFPTRWPTAYPTASPTTHRPSASPSGSPTTYPTTYPTMSPTTSFPTRWPTAYPTASPTTSKYPTSSPTQSPTQSPTIPPNAICEIEGLATVTLWSNIGLLPAGCRPKKQLIFTVNNHAGQARVDVRTDGYIAYTAGSKDHSWLAMSGILFARNPSNTMALSNSWVAYGASYGTPTYTLTTAGLCEVEGLVKSGAWGHIATLPSDCRPNKRLIFSNNNHASQARVDVLENGEIYWVAGGNGHRWISLSGIKFDTDSRRRLAEITEAERVPKRKLLTADDVTVAEVAENCRDFLTSGHCPDTDALLYWDMEEAQDGCPLVVEHSTCTDLVDNIHLLPDQMACLKNKASLAYADLDYCEGLDDLSCTNKYCLDQSNRRRLQDRAFVQNVGDVMDLDEALKAKGTAHPTKYPTSSPTTSPTPTPSDGVIMQNGWVRYPGATYGYPSYHVVGDFCVVEGLAYGGSSWGHIGTLPTICRPKKRLIFNMNNHAGSARVDVLTNGNIVWVAGSQEHHWISMSGIVFTTQSSSTLSLYSPNSAYGGDYGSPTYKTG